MIEILEFGQTSFQWSQTHNVSSHLLNFMLFGVGVKVYVSKFIQDDDNNNNNDNDDHNKDLMKMKMLIMYNSCKVIFFKYNF